MGSRECCVQSCGRSSHDQRGMKLLDGVTFHCFPAWRTNEGSHISELTRRRRAAWVAAVGRSDITFKHIPSSMRVCSRHFHSGKPAYEMLDSDPDWGPSLHLGHDDLRSTQAKPLSQLERRRKRRAAEASDAPRSESEGCAVVLRAAAAAPSRTDEALPDESVAEDEAAGPPAAKRTDVGFRDFFRDALEASLEASIRSRAQSKSRSSSTEYEVELNLKLPPLRGEPAPREESAASSSSASCLNCVLLQRRIRELENMLFQAEPIEEDWDLPSCEEDEGKDLNESTRSTLPGRVGFHDNGGEDSESDSSGSSGSSSGSSCPPPVRPPRPALRFREEWLSLFSFLRYSPSLNLMWCHVCRVQADTAHRNLGLIKGSTDFKRSSLLKHSNARYHQDNLRRYQMMSPAPQL
ncbi:uncharacterized protein LOC142384476 [Odontesthes bonariensis]|uniref:uncharacterized protein LOC142384476 n=1 Tax=Odontesthes bonariensis TaxID=219752 RepID=UPI003F5883EA